MLSSTLSDACPVGAGLARFGVLVDAVGAVGAFGAVGVELALHGTTGMGLVTLVTHDTNWCIFF